MPSTGMLSTSFLHTFYIHLVLKRFLRLMLTFSQEISWILLLHQSVCLYNLTIIESPALGPNIKVQWPNQLKLGIIIYRLQSIPYKLIAAHQL